MRLVLALLTVAALAVAAPAAADPPTEFPIFDAFADVNPCTGAPMTVTFVGTLFVHLHASREVNLAHRSITTSDGFVGHGTDLFVDNEQIIKFTVNDILMNATTGDRFRVRIVFVLDLSTETVRVQRFEQTCLGP